MAEAVRLHGASRETRGTGGARATRRESRVPAIIYGNRQSPVPISLDLIELRKQLKSPGFFSHVFEIDVDGDTHRVLARDLQQHPVTDEPIHVDFMRFSARTRVTADVNVVFENEEEAPGLKKGGVLNVVLHTISLDCKADRIPEQVSVDLSGLELGDVIHVSSVPLPDGVELGGVDPETTVATIAAPSVAPAEEGEAEEGEEAPGEGAAPSESDEAAESDEGEESSS